MNAKQRILRTLARSIPRSRAVAALFGSQGLRVACYHHIADTEPGLIDGLGITTSPALFAAHLDALRRDYDVVDLDTVLRGPLPKRPLLITFDDAFRSVLDVAGPMLRERGMPAVYFLNAGCIADGRPLPEHLLNHLIHQHGITKVVEVLGLDAARCRSIGDVVATLDLDGWQQLIPRLATGFGVDPVATARDSGLYLTPADVAKLAAVGIEVGNHTASHFPGRVLDAGTARREIVDARRQLEQWTGRPVRAYAQPFGCGSDMTPVVRTAIAEAGAEVAFLVESVANRVGAPQHGIRLFDRVGFRHEPAAELFLHMELLPRVRAVRARMRGTRPTFDATAGSRSP